MERLEEKRVVLLAVKPCFMLKILVGLKTIDIRRVKPSLAPPYRVLFYTSGIGVCGRAVCRWEYEIVPGNDFMWLYQTGLSKPAYSRFLAGSRHPVGLHLEEIAAMRAVSLEGLRDIIDGFRAPRSFRYLSVEEAGRIEDLSARPAVSN